MLKQANRKFFTQTKQLTILAIEEDKSTRKAEFNQNKDDFLKISGL